MTIPTPYSFQFGLKENENLQRTEKHPTSDNTAQGLFGGIHLEMSAFVAGTDLTLGHFHTYTEGCSRCAHFR